jgi:hypothetical protein
MKSEYFSAIFNPFASQAPPVQSQQVSQPQQHQPDLVNFFDAPAASNPSQPQAAANNPFASFTAPNPVTQPQQSMGAPSSNPFEAFPPTNNFGQMPTTGPFSTPAPSYGAPSQQTFNPFGNAVPPASAPIPNATPNFGGYSQTPFCKFSDMAYYYYFSASGNGTYNQPSFFDSQVQRPAGQSNTIDPLSSMVGNMSIGQPYQYQQNQQWQPPTYNSQAQPFGNPYAPPFQPQQ